MPESSDPTHAPTPAPQPADPTIAQALQAYLAAEKQRLKPRTHNRYAAVIDLLMHSLDGYGPNLVDPAELDLYAQAGYDVASQEPPFCEVFGPSYIPEHLSEFLTYFLPRKTGASEATLRTAGTVTRKLTRWLAEQGHIDPEEAELAQETGLRASRELPAAQRLAEMLYAETAGLPVRSSDIEGYFEVTRVGRDRLWLVDFLGSTDYGAVKVPEDACQICQVGWQIAGAVRRHGRGYRLVDAYNVYT